MVIFATLLLINNNTQTNEMKKEFTPRSIVWWRSEHVERPRVLCRSAVSTKETIEVNGETYPVYKMEISNTSHPFYTGKMKLVDTAGRVDKFMSRYAQKRYDKKSRQVIAAASFEQRDSSLRRIRFRCGVPCAGRRRGGSVSIRWGVCRCGVRGG